VLVVVVGGPVVGVSVVVDVEGSWAVVVEEEVSVV